jgi:hypothetical protein
MLCYRTGRSDLKAFHDRLLEQGSLPIALVTPEMLASGQLAALQVRPEARELAKFYSSGTVRIGLRTAESSTLDRLRDSIHDARKSHLPLPTKEEDT